MRRLLPAIFALFACATAHAQNGAYQSPSTASGGGGSGTVTSIVTSAPLGGGTITTSGTITCITCAVTSATLAQFAATTSAQLASVISDETGTGLLVFATSPVLTTPNLGTPSAINLTNATSPPTWNQNTTGTASNLSGTPALPNGTTATTQTVGDNTTKLATTAFVLANAAGGGVSSFSGDGALLTNSASTGAVTATLGTAGAHKWFGNSTGITAAPGYESLTAADIPTLNQNTTGTAANLTGCTPSTAGSVCYWNGSAWTLLAGNASGTNFLQETSSGVPSWAAAGGSGTVTSIATTGPITGGTITTTGTIACATCVTSAAALTANQAVNGNGSQATVTGFADTAGTITSGHLACYTASNTIGNCTGIPSNNFIGVFNSSTTWIASGEVSVTLDGTVNVTFGDNLCASSSAGVAHDNGAVACATGEGVAVVKTTASSVSSATAFVRMY